MKKPGIVFLLVIFSISIAFSGSLKLKIKNDNNKFLIMEIENTSPENGYYIVWNWDFFKVKAKPIKSKKKKSFKTTIPVNVTLCNIEDLKFTPFVFIAPHTKIVQKVRLVSAKHKRKQDNIPCLILPEGSYKIKVIYSFKDKDRYFSKWDSKFRGSMFYHPWKTVNKLKSNKVVFKVN